MRRFISLACVIVLMAAPVLASDGQVPKHSLARMGLGGMKVTTDQEGLKVRGTSIAIATSFAFGGTTVLSIGSPVSIGNHFAFSANFVIGSGSFAGGAGVASAH
ncbi:MAG TPA: hypothetical protein VFG04_06480 [Planctomycetaceae bacterium]|jgi:hypothetical protein|nr:hypothetical protein [Planctomycetaceae bacterium]